MKKYEYLYNLIYSQIADRTLTLGMALPTEAELAHEHGMSRQTVRKALEMLRESGYIYSIQGSGSFVKTAATVPVNRCIAVITTYFSEYIFPSILRGISYVAAGNDFTIEINATNNSISAERDILLRIIEKPIAGIIVEGTKAALPNPNVDLYRQLNERGIPIIFINCFYPELISERILSVTTDDFRGGYTLAERLLAEGHTSIGCIFKSDDAQGINRYFGFISALTEQKVEYNDNYFIWFTSETKRALANTLYSSNIFSECSAIVCYNDQVAEIVCSCLRRTNHQVRSIVSFDFNLNSDLVPPGVSFYSLSHPRNALGEIAAKKLINLLEGKSEESAILPWNSV